MSKGNVQAVNEFTNLAQDWRAMTIAATREFRGPNAVSETNSARTRLVAITYRDKETGAEVIQNYSLDKPSYLAGVLEAVSPGNSQEMLESIDWEVAEDTAQVIGVDVLCKVYQEEFPLGSGLMRNKVGRVENINFTFEEADA